MSTGEADEGDFTATIAQERAKIRRRRLSPSEWALGARKPLVCLTQHSPRVANDAACQRPKAFS